MPLRHSRRAHTRAATTALLTAPIAVPSSTGTVPVSVSTVPVSVSTVPSSSGSVAFASAVRGGHRGWPPVVPSTLRDEPTPPSLCDFVPSRDGVLALIRDELWTLQSLVSCSLLLGGLGCLMVPVAFLVLLWPLCLG